MIIKLAKVLKIVLVLLAVFTLVNTMVYAYDYSSQITSLEGSQGDTSINATATNIVGAVIAVMRTVAVGVAIIMLIAVAIKYMSSAPGERAEIKKHAVIYVVGAIVLFGASGILGIIAKFANTNIKP